MSGQEQQGNMYWAFEQFLKAIGSDKAITDQNKDTLAKTLLGKPDKIFDEKTSSLRIYQEFLKQMRELFKDDVLKQNDLCSLIRKREPQKPAKQSKPHGVQGQNRQHHPNNQSRNSGKSVKGGAVEASPASQKN